MHGPHPPTCQSSPARLAAFVCVLLPVVGCSADTPALRRELARGLDSPDSRRSDPGVEAMRPMLGQWVVDLDATLAENAPLPQDMLEFIRRDLTEYPFELTITDRDYVSRSRVKTNADQYSVLSVDGDTVTLSLSAATQASGPPTEGRSYGSATASY